MRYNVIKNEIISDMFREYAMEDGYSEEELIKIDLSYVKKQTNSKTEIRTMRNSYFLGMFRGLKYMDDCHEEKILPKCNIDVKDSPVSNSFKVIRHERIFNMLKKDALFIGFSEQELEISLFNLINKTKSGKNSRLIKLSYYLGILKGIAYVDESCAKLRPFEHMHVNDPYDEPPLIFKKKDNGDPYNE